jgi:hypothetical protein
MRRLPDDFKSVGTHVADHIERVCLIKKKDGNLYSSVLELEDRVDGW